MSRKYADAIFTCCCCCRPPGKQSMFGFVRCPLPLSAGSVDFCCDRALRSVIFIMFDVHKASPRESSRSHVSEWDHELSRKLTRGRHENSTSLRPQASGVRCLFVCVFLREASRHREPAVCFSTFSILDYLVRQGFRLLKAVVATVTSHRCSWFMGHPYNSSSRIHE